MSVDEERTDNEQEGGAYQESSERLNSSSVPTAVVREVASGLKSLARVMPYEDYAKVVYRIARVRWHCQLAASHAQGSDESM